MSKHSQKENCIKCGKPLYGELATRECGSCSEAEATYIPTQTEISIACKQVREEWSEEEELERRVGRYNRRIPLKIKTIKFIRPINISHEEDAHPEPEAA